MNEAVPRAGLSWRAPSFPLAAAALLAPGIAVLQSKAMAPLALIALAACILCGWHAQRRFPWPRGLAVLVGLALGAWGTLSTFWALEPGRALSNGLSVLGLVLLAGGAARAVQTDTPASRRKLGQALLAGLTIGLTGGVIDHLSGSQLRAAVRGLDQIPPELAFGLKPAASVMALLLPLLAGLSMPPLWRSTALLAGLVLLLLIPGDTARLAALAGLVAVALVALEGRLRPALSPRMPVWLGAVMGLVVVLTPLLLAPALQMAAPVVERLPPSAVHRLAIWDFALQRAAQRPVLGWGMEAARALPGGKDHPEPERLSRLGVHSETMQAWFAAPHLELMPLHPHNGPLQIRLELGWIGNVLAATAFLALGFAASRLEAPAAASGAMASGFVTFLASFGTWQSWWLCSAALALALSVALAPCHARRHASALD